MSEHACHRCAGGNPWDPGTLGHARWEAAHSAHLALWTFIEATPIPRFTDWLSRRLAR